MVMASVVIMSGLSWQPDMPRTATDQSAQTGIGFATTRAASSQAPDAGSGAARWLAQSAFVVSSLETGRIGYLEAWGGDEFGYSYTYALSQQPNGVSVDPETGILTLASRLSVGIHVMDVAVANRRISTKVAHFPVTLDVREGVTSNRVGDQILHRTYSVDSGVFGHPRGNDYTDVLLNVRQAILADQIAAGDDSLRATIYFRRGNLYDYTINSWPVGIQYASFEPDPDYNPAGPRPRLRNVRRNFMFDSEIAILGSGSGSAFDHLPDQLKTYSPAIYGAEPGQDRVRLRNSREAVTVKIGRWHLVASYDQQVGGYPPNLRYFDFVKVIAVEGNTALLDRRLRHHHRDNYFEDPSNPKSMGLARIIPLDLGGPGGLLPEQEARLTIRQTFKDIEFVKNPSTENGSNVVIYIANALDASFENCVMPRPVPTIVNHMRFLGGVIGSSEPDKIISTLIFDNVESGEIEGATGVEFYLMRNSRSAPIQISPRQFRAIRSVIDATGNTRLWYPITWAYNGPILSVELESTTLRINPTNRDTRVMPAIQRPTLRLGKDAEWQGGRLAIPRESPAFLDWEVWLFEGMLVDDGADPTSWGVVRELDSPGDGSAIWAHIQWVKGTRPIHGLIRGYRGHSLAIDGSSKLGAGADWNTESGGFVRQDLPSHFANGHGDFPVGYPSLEYGF
jgi:hypothetical protein